MWEGKARCSTELTASCILPTPRHHPTADHRLVSSVPSFPINTTLVALVFTLGTPTYAFPLPSASDSDSLEAALKALFPFVSGVLGLLLPAVLAAHVQLESIWITNL